MPTPTPTASTKRSCRPMAAQVRQTSSTSRCTSTDTANSWISPGCTNDRPRTRASARQARSSPIDPRGEVPRTTLGCVRVAATSRTMYSISTGSTDTEAAAAIKAATPSASSTRGTSLTRAPAWCAASTSTSKAGSG
jgi:hypothetical protein